MKLVLFVKEVYICMLMYFFFLYIKDFNELKVIVIL